MPKILLLVFFLFIFFSFPQTSFSRTTPEDILNSRLETYNQRVSGYSPASKQKLDTYHQKISDLNKKITDEYEFQMLTQGVILDEYLKRKGLLERQADGINRNLSDPVENARYWITFAHEAVAYQAAKNYVFNLNGESNLNRDILTQINSLQYDISVLRGKVQKSQTILESLISK